MKDATLSNPLILVAALIEENATPESSYSPSHTMLALEHRLLVQNPKIYRDLDARLTAMEEALRWYADDANWQNSRPFADDANICFDEGQRARAALALSGAERGDAP